MVQNMILQIKNKKVKFLVPFIIIMNKIQFLILVKRKISQQNMVFLILLISMIIFATKEWSSISMEENQKDQEHI